MLFTKEMILKVLEVEPLLGDKGIMPYPLVDINEQDKLYQDRERELLADDVKSFGLCCEWLSIQGRTKNINELSSSSYTLKHCVENWAKKKFGQPHYISNGSLIAAAIHLGFKWKKYEDSPNVKFNITKKLVDADCHG